MTEPTVKVITDHCTRAGATEKQAKAWARFLHGLDWDTIKPLVTMSAKARVHPAIAAPMAARSTGDEQMRSLLEGHIESKAPTSGQHGPTPGAPPPDTPTQ